MYGFNFETEEILALLVAVLVASVAVFAFHGSFEVSTVLWSVLAAILAVSSREIGQRYLSRQMHAYHETSLRPRGTFITVATAVAAFAGNASIALILPLSSSFEVKDYEQWGKTVDVIWPKREYWIGGIGVLSVLLVWLPAYLLNLNVLSSGLGLFALSQMVPLNETDFFQGKTDGAYVLLHSGYVYLLLTGLSILAVVLPTLL